VGGRQGGDSGEGGGLQTVETGGGNGGIQPVVTNASLKLLTWLADYAALTRCEEKPKQAKTTISIGFLRWHVAIFSAFQVSSQW